MTMTIPGMGVKYPSTLMEWYTAPPPNGSTGIRRIVAVFELPFELQYKLPMYTIQWKALSE